MKPKILLPIDNVNVFQYSETCLNIPSSTNHVFFQMCNIILIEVSISPAAYNTLLCTIVYQCRSIDNRVNEISIYSITLLSMVEVRFRVKAHDQIVCK